MAEIKITGDTSLAVVFGDTISEEISKLVQALDSFLLDAALPGISETVPTYCTLMIHYDPEILPYGALRDYLESILPTIKAVSSEIRTVIEIPVCYGGEYGEDLAQVAKLHNMTEADVIRIHSTPEYRIYMLGFTPGFAYMGGMEEAIATPRLKTPRVRIPAGSVGIAGSQTGIYPLDSPGGWQLIGRTPVRLYDPNRENPILLDAGMYVRFIPISEKEYARIAALAESESDSCRTYERSV